MTDSSTRAVDLERLFDFLEGKPEQQIESLSRDLEALQAQNRELSSRLEEGRKLNERLQEKLETATRDLANRASSRDLARAAVDEAVAELKRLHAERDDLTIECRKLRAHLRTYAACPSSSDDGVASLAADPSADASQSDDSSDLEPAVSSRAAASPEPAWGDRVEEIKQRFDLEARVAALEAAVSYASDRKDAMDGRLAALEEASARADAERSEAAKPLRRGGEPIPSDGSSPWERGERF